MAEIQYWRVFPPISVNCSAIGKKALKQALARLSANFTHFLKIHLIGDWAKPARMAIHGAFEPIACRQQQFLGLIE